MVGLLKRVVREEPGSALVEAAVVFPMLMVFGFGVFEFSNVFFQHQEVTTGVRDAARYLARVDNPSDATAQLRAKTLAVTGAIDGTKPRVPGWTVGGVTITVDSIPNPVIAATSAPAYRGSNPLNIVKVSTSFSYQQMGFLTGFGLGAATFNLAHSERSIGE
jgi:Flp pilus assembly protein TadG